VRRNGNLVADVAYRMKNFAMTGSGVGHASRWSFQWLAGHDNAHSEEEPYR
jgi:hypothetical protein